ncbi:galactonate dehydratase [Clostridia bacterium]|nr:galactonate dehydratase [Clostridia bacterium]
MKITGIELRQYTIPYTPEYIESTRSVGPLDIYDEYAQDIRRPYVRGPGSYRNGMLTGAFLAVTTDEGVEGLHGPIIYRSQLMTAVDGLAHHLIGRDPLETRLLWDIMSRFDRHSRAGIHLMAISTVDIALWDLKGKILGQPVYKLLGGGRSRIRPYISTLGFSVEPDRAREKALVIKAMGIPAQKWFFKYGPNAGAEGMRKNLELAFALRDALGTDYELMFDCWLGWTIPYAKRIFLELEQVRPLWVEEALRPQMQDGYRQLKQETSIPLAAGEHLYTRMEVNPCLSAGIFDVMQSDPEWCGGITEALRIADLCEVYGTTFIPHGHALLPAMQVVASMPPDVSPYCEVLLHSIGSKTAFFKHNRLQPDGYLYMNEEPGIGETLDEGRIVKVESIHSFEI